MLCSGNPSTKTNHRFYETKPIAIRSINKIVDPFTDNINQTFEYPKLRIDSMNV